MKINCKFNKITVNKEYTKKLEAQIEIELRQGTRAWLRAARDAVPVWSGQARGSLMLAQGSFGDLARYLNVAENINPQLKRIKADKNSLTGGQQASYTFTHLGHRYSFNYKNTIAYYEYNDNNPRPENVEQQQIAPWRSLLKGGQAFQEYMTNKGIPNLQKIGLKSLLTFTPITLS